MSMTYSEKFLPIDDSFANWDDFRAGKGFYDLAKCYHCGAKKYDENHKRITEIVRYCKFKSCIQYFCNSCKRWDSGWGKILCKCSTGRSGHNTYHEFPAPSGKKKIAKKRKWKAMK